MKNDIFSIGRFGQLCRQRVMHSYKTSSLFIIGFCGAVFILFFFIDFNHNFRAVGLGDWLGVSLFVSTPLAILYAGTAFPGFRTKEKSYDYLLVPASLPEKFVFEFFNRIVLYLLVVTFLIWLMFMMEQYIASIFFSKEEILSVDWSAIPSTIGRGMQPDEVFWATLLIVGLCALVFTIPFTGAAMFNKMPLLKTLFAVAVIFFFHLLLVYLFAKLYAEGRTITEGRTILWMGDGLDVLRFVACYVLAGNIGLLVAAYLKLKEKEV